MHIFEYLVTSWWQCLRWWKYLGRRALWRKYNTGAGIWDCMEGLWSLFNLPVHAWQWDQPVCCSQNAFLVVAKSLLPRWTPSFWNCKLKLFLPWVVLSWYLIAPTENQLIQWSFCLVTVYVLCKSIYLELSTAPWELFFTWQKYRRSFLTSLNHCKLSKYFYNKYELFFYPRQMKTGIFFN